MEETELEKTTIKGGPNAEADKPSKRHFCNTNKCTCIVLLLLVVAVAAVAVITMLVPGVRGPIPEPEEHLEWWKTCVIYQIYPRSFQDTNNDGIGDLPGITLRLGYIEDLKVGAIWLSPFYESPMRDFGYDVTNYTNINHDYGNMTDFEELIEQAHKKGIKVIVDFVPNHTSNESVWFEKSRSGTDTKYKDYYIWASAKNDTSGNREPPNNWKSMFGGSAWEWDETRNQYYYHAFLASQPDLNYRNPEVLKEIDDVLQFWLDKGVDGFRIDAIPYLFEVRNLNLNENLTEIDPFDSDICEYTRNQEEIFDVVKRWKNLVQEHERKTGKSILLVAETWGVSQEQRSKYYDAGVVPFFFDLINADECGATSACYASIIQKGVNLTDDEWPNFVIGNHDNRRVSDRKGPQYVDALNMMLLTLPGTPTTYYGEELGMRGGNYSGIDPRDPFAITSKDSANSRDSERNPMQWNTSMNAGFSDVEPWLPVTPNTNYQEINVQVESNSSSSHLEIYKSLVLLRQLPAFENNHISFPSDVVEVLVYIRKDKSSKYLVALNLSSAQQFISVVIPNMVGEIQISTLPRKDKTISLDNISLKRGEGLVLKLVKK